MNKRGFTLLELMLAGALALILLGLMGINLRSHTPKYSSRALAEVLIKELQNARLQAMASHTFVVLGFPHNNGNLPSQSYDLMEGPSHARLLRQTRLEAEHPGGQLFLGTWPLASGQFSQDPPSLGRETVGFTWSNWFAPNPVPAEHLLGFSPAGEVISSKLPLLGGEYHVVVGSGMKTTAGPSLEEISEPFTVALSPRGDCRLLEGVVQASSSLRNLQGNQGPGSSSPISPWWGGSANQVPQVVKVDLGPKPGSTPTNIDSLVAPGGFTTLTVEATDADGDALNCEWECDGGTLGCQGRQAMDFDPASQRWRSVQVFSPNPLDDAGRVYQLTCHVTDPRGTEGVAASGVLLSQRLEMRKENRVIFMRFPYGDLYESGSDGSDMTTLPTQGRQGDYPCLSPDGSRVLYTAQFAGGACQIYSMNRDGTDARALTSQGICYGGSFSADGSKIVFCSTRNGAAGLYIMPACGEVAPSPDATPPQPVATGMVACWNQPSFNLAGTKVCFAGYPAGSNQSAGFVVDLASGVSTQVTPAVTHNAGNNSYHQLRYCQIAGHEDLISGSMALSNLPGADATLFVTRDGGVGNYHAISGPAGEPSCENLSFLRDGTGFVYVGNGISRCDFNFSTLTTGTSRPIVTGLNLNNPSCW
ncbi:MAG: hypothetical protein U0931_35745 [Vulcanimicrobiota bacterium]